MWNPEDTHERGSNREEDFGAHRVHRSRSRFTKHLHLTGAEGKAAYPSLPAPLGATAHRAC